MARRASVSIEVPGLALSFHGDQDLFAREVQPILDGVVRGTWRKSGPLPVAPGGPAGPDEYPAPAAAPAPAPAAAAPAPATAASPAAAPAAPGAGTDFRPLLASLAKGEGRRAEREAVLVALAGLASEGKRDATAPEVVAWLEKRGFPARGLHPRPILAKLCHRKGLAVPGLQKNTFRATPAGIAHVARALRGA
jgi:hypothetical protein